jgi:hypothetical protein
MIPKMSSVDEEMKILKGFGARHSTGPRFSILKPGHPTKYSEFH